MNTNQIKNIPQIAMDHFSDPEMWMEFLENSSWHYKYSFKNQLLISAQRPDATAVTTMRAWNSKLNRYINAGAKRILIVEQKNDKRVLTNVFDVKDTHLSNPGGFQFGLWQFNPDQETKLLERLKGWYNKVDFNELNDFKSYLTAVVHDIMEENQDDIESEITYNGNPKYHHLDSDATILLLQNSIIYQILKRCGYEPRQFFGPEDFKEIGNILNFEALTFLGEHINEVVKPLLIEIGKCVQVIEKEKGEQTNERHEANTDVGSGLLSGRGLPQPGLRSIDATESADREIRTVARSVSGETPPVNHNESDLFGRDQRISGDSGSERQTATEPADGGISESNTRPGSEQPAAGMGDLHENDRETSGRNRPSGTDIRQIDLFSYTQSLNETESVEMMPSVFSVPDDVINHILRSGSNDPDLPLKLAYHFSFKQPPGVSEAFLRSSYGENGKGLIINNQPWAVWWNADGLFIVKGKTAHNLDETVQVYLEWDEVAEQIEELLKDGQYLTSDQLSHVLDFEIEEIAKICWYLHHDMSVEGQAVFPHQDILFNDGISGFPDTVSHIKNLLVTSIQTDGTFLEDFAWKMEDLRVAVKSHPEYMRSNFYSAGQLVNRLDDLVVYQQRFFESNLESQPILKRFISQDEIDLDLLRNTPVTDGKYRIYHYFTENYSRQDKANFLKDEYGIGGHAGLNILCRDHNSKGLIYYRDDHGDRIEVKFNWLQVTDRIDQLIKDGRYHLDGYFADVTFRNILIQETPFPDLKQAIATTVEDHTLAIGEKEEIIKALYRMEGDYYTPETGEFKQLYSDRGITFVKKDDPDEIHFRSWFAVVSSVDSMVNSKSNAYFPSRFNDPITSEDMQNLIVQPVVSGTLSQMLEIEEELTLPLATEEINRNDNVESEEFLNFDAEQLKKELERRDFENDTAAVDEMLSQALAQSVETEIQIGDRYQINGRMFVVDEVNSITDTVNLMDITFKEGNGFPIFRSETIAFLMQYEKFTDQTQEPRKSQDTLNFKLSNEDFKDGSLREKFQANILAIETLKTIESEQRQATADEQKALAAYVGWGGIAQAFDANNIHWREEYDKLEALLTPDEYAKARESTLNAHYTSPTVIKAMYGALSEMGFRTGNILEPSMGTGHFFGMLPENMKQSKLYGVEIDSLTCRIAKQLYPEADIYEGGFEKTDYHNNFFDVAIGNVPFGDYKLYDKAYQKENFLIHDYFFAKSLDKIRPGGVMAMITSKGTMDKKSSAVREYLAKRAELIGAVRLPNNAFNHAGTEVTSDILFFKKRDRMTLGNEDWVHLDTDENDITMNAYFVSHPEMILGEMALVSGRFGEETACLPVEGKDLGIELKKALVQLSYHFPEDSVENILDEEIDSKTLPADPNVDNYSYTLVENEIYYRNNSIMTHMEMPDKKEERIKGMIELRDTVRSLIRLQLDDASNAVIENKQMDLNQVYDRYTKIHGRINSRGNKLAFEEDGSYWLLCALEKMDDEGNYLGKSDIFTQRTIQPYRVVTEVDTANEALLVSIGEKACIDLEYMSNLCGKSQQEMIADLQGVIFHEPIMNSWVTADEYLSGNVRLKLEQAKAFAVDSEMYQINVDALEKAQPKDLEAAEIEVHLGATWIKPHYIDQFIMETFKPAAHLIENEYIKTHFSPHNSSWNIEGKSIDSYSNVMANSTYGTNRANAYRILENALNLKDMRIMDTISTPDGDRQVVNREETILANQKQELIKEAFKDWIFKDQERRDALVKVYNQNFNATRPREYDGQHIILHGVSPDIQLRDYQKNAIARALYGGNTLLGHCVGAGKTYEMTAIAMESKYLGLSSKSMFVVPNHLVGQWGSEFLSLYPGARILVAQKKDFMPGNRKKFCSRIATGNYDAVIIGHSQFEKIPLSKEFQAEMINRQIDDVLLAINDAVDGGSEQYTIKQLEKTRKSLEARLEKLNDTEKDHTVFFEELGIDRLFVDEAHNFKNLFLYTKMRNVAGVGQSEAQKSTDMFNKCQYMDQLTGGKGVVFATGTPISNSIAELYTMMRYLQFNRLQESGLGHFDSWAGNFTQQVTAVELSPEGTGYRSKTRLARFYNLPELMAFFKDIADIQTPDMLKLPVPEVVYEDVISKPSSFQKEMLNELVSRAEAVRNRIVEPYEDNMLKITNDGRKLALDQRLINPLLPDSEDSKANLCVENAYSIWSQTHQNKAAQLLFCDLSTPHGNGCFNVYDDIKDKLIKKGVPEKEIAFIHDANTDVKKIALFNQVRSGQVRFLLGSTPKLGAGTNVQDRLIALHHLDVPWKPSDIEQQEGRILRQGNMNPQVKIFRYITEETFDAYSWQLIENKQKFIGQIMTSKTPTRSCEDVDEQALSFAEVKALATGNPLIKEKMDLDIKVMKLKLLKANFISQQYKMEDRIAKVYPQTIGNLNELKKSLEVDQKAVQKADLKTDIFSITLFDKQYTEKKDGGQAIIDAVSTLKANKQKVIGDYAGFKLLLANKGFDGIELILKGQTNHHVPLGKDPLGNVTRINNVLENITNRIKLCDQEISDAQEHLKNAQIEVKKPFTQDRELSESLMRLKELDMLLSTDGPKELESTFVMEGEQQDEWKEQAM